jgi:hypothetical protein
MRPELLACGAGKWEVRGPNAIAHIIKHPDGTFTVKEDHQGGSISDLDDAYESARKITGDFADTHS